MVVHVRLFLQQVIVLQIVATSSFGAPTTAPACTTPGCATEKLTATTTAMKPPKHAVNSPFNHNSEEKFMKNALFTYMYMYMYVVLY